MAKPTEKPDKKDKKSLANELLDDDFFKPPVESKSGGKSPAAAGGGKAGGSARSGGGGSAGPIVAGVVVLLLGGAAAVFFLNPGGLKDKILGTTPAAKPAAATAPATAPKPAQPAAVAPAPPAGQAAPATASKPATGAEPEPAADAKKETRFFLKLDAVMSGGEAHVKNKQALDLLGLPYSESEQVKTKTLTHLYLNRKYATHEEAQAALDTLNGMGLSSQPAITELGPEEITIKFGTFETASDVKKLASTIEAGGEFETVKTTEKLEEKWTTIYINKEKPINLRKDAETIKGLLDPRGVGASIESVEVTVGQ